MTGFLLPLALPWTLQTRDEASQVWGGSPGLGRLNAEVRCPGEKGHLCPCRGVLRRAYQGPGNDPACEGHPWVLWAQWHLLPGLQFAEGSGGNRHI